MKKRILITLFLAFLIVIGIYAYLSIAYSPIKKTNSLYECDYVCVMYNYDEMGYKDVKYTKKYLNVKAISKDEFDLSNGINVIKDTSLNRTNDYYLISFYSLDANNNKQIYNFYNLNDSYEELKFLSCEYIDQRNNQLFPSESFFTILYNAEFYQCVPEEKYETYCSSISDSTPLPYYGYMPTINFVCLMKNYKEKGYTNVSDTIRYLEVNVMNKEDYLKQEGKNVVNTNQTLKIREQYLIKFYSLDNNNDKHYYDFYNLKDSFVDDITYNVKFTDDNSNSIQGYNCNFYNISYNGEEYIAFRGEYLNFYLNHM